MPDYSCKYCFIHSKNEYFTTKDKVKWEKHEQSKKHLRILDMFNDVNPNTAEKYFAEAGIISTKESRLQERVDRLESILRRHGIDFPK